MENGQKNIEGFLGKRERSESEEPIHVNQAGPSRVHNTTLAQTPEAASEWVCSRCGERVTYPLDRDIEEVKQEHEDYHYALELSRAIEAPGKDPKKRKKEVGIKAFFKTK
jgi:DNA polymerase eta